MEPQAGRGAEVADLDRQAAAEKKQEQILLGQGEAERLRQEEAVSWNRHRAQRLTPPSSSPCATLPSK